MITFFALLILAVPALSSLEQLSCYSGSNFTVDLLNGNKAFIQKAEVNVYFSRNKVHVYSYMNSVNILINDTIIAFKVNIHQEREHGRMLTKNFFENVKIVEKKLACLKTCSYGNLSLGNSETKTQRIDQIIYLQAKGIGKLQKYNDKTQLTECQIHLIKNVNNSLRVPREVEDEFLQIADSCIRYRMCSKIGTVQPEHYVVPKNDYELESAVYSRPLEKNLFSKGVSLIAESNETEKAVKLESIINTIVDFALDEVIRELKKSHEESVAIPDVSEAFSVGSGIFETTGRFDATGGHFGNLTTFSRTSDAIFHRQELKFSISCGFGLSEARIEYTNYKLKFGIIKVSGNLSANIDRLLIDTKFSVDYNQVPCKAKLEYLKNAQLGRLNVEITGLSPLNSLASYIATLITREWEGEISQLIENKVSEVLNYQMNSFNCEKFRP